MPTVNNIFNIQIARTYHWYDYTATVTVNNANSLVLTHACCYWPGARQGYTFTQSTLGGVAYPVLRSEMMGGLSDWTNYSVWFGMLPGSAGAKTLYFHSSGLLRKMVLSVIEITPASGKEFDSSWLLGSGYTGQLVGGSANPYNSPPGTGSQAGDFVIGATFDSDSDLGYTKYSTTRGTYIVKLNADGCEHIISYINATQANDYVTHHYGQGYGYWGGVGLAIREKLLAIGGNGQVIWW